MANVVHIQVFRAKTEKDNYAGNVNIRTDGDVVSARGIIRPGKETGFVCDFRHSVNYNNKWYNQLIVGNELRGVVESGVNLIMQSDKNRITLEHDGSQWKVQGKSPAVPIEGAAQFIGKAQEQEPGEYPLTAEEMAERGEVTETQDDLPA